MINEANNVCSPKNLDIYTDPVLCDSESCEDCKFNPLKKMSIEQEHERHDRIISRVMDKRNPILKNHYCNPTIMVSEGSEQAWPSCNPFCCKCDGGDNGELDEDKRVQLEWTCFHGIERCDIEFGNLSFQDW